MDQDQEKLLAELLVDFRIEAIEHYEAIVSGLILLENSSDVAIRQSTIEKIFREIHSLKGASRAVNLQNIEKLCSGLESVFNSLKKGETHLSTELLDLFHKAVDELNQLLKEDINAVKGRGNYNLLQILKNLDFAIRNSNPAKKDDFRTEVNFLEEKKSVNESVDNPNHSISEHSEGKSGLSEQAGHSALHSSSKEVQTVRISVDKLYSLLQQSEELISVKSSLDYFVSELQNFHQKNSLLISKIHEKELNKKRTGNDDKNLRNHEDELGLLVKKIALFQRTTGRMVDELLHDMKSALLFPFSSLLTLFPKIVRDLSKEHSKDIELIIEGDTIEIDKRILEEIKDPLIHLIRNCVDHGIESEKIRLSKGKSAKGRIEIRIIQDADRKVVLYIKDDGAGIDKDKIISSALKSGMMKKEEVEKLSDTEINSLIFSSGLSTSQFITDISGRGLGMAIVAEKVVKLGGTIEIETRKDHGTTFIIKLPQTLATFRGVLFKSVEQQFIIPSFAVEKSIRIHYSDIISNGANLTIRYKNEIIALSLISDVLRITPTNKRRRSDQMLHVLILNVSNKRIGFVVDEILGEQEGIVKDLGKHITHITNILGASILGNGKVVLILHPSELMDSAANAGTTLDSSLPESNTSATKVQKRILVAEDSITIRTLLRNFIENAGYVVKISVDGMEAFQFLQNEDFDLVVSDIEMPRMNGFELTAKIRNDNKYADLPVILLTALESAEDKQRGMDVGANAYILKSSFEKSNLVDTIQRLI